MERFCSKHNFTNTYSVQDRKMAVLRNTLLRHLIFDDQRQFVFCYIPKV